MAKFAASKERARSQYTYSFEERVNINTIFRKINLQFFNTACFLYIKRHFKDGNMFLRTTDFISNKSGTFRHINAWGRFDLGTF